jgi:hypothetical protein
LAFLGIAGADLGISGADLGISGANLGISSQFPDPISMYRLIHSAAARSSSYASVALQQ